MNGGAATGFVWHESYMWHDTGTGAAFLPAGGALEPEEHIESPRAKRRFHNLLAYSGLLDRLTAIEPRPAADAELERVHDSAHIERVERVSASGGGEVGEEAPIGAGGAAIARLAAGGCLAAVEEVVAGRVRNAYALVRPPGHHAGPGGALGFCVYSNAAVAAAHARDALGLSRVAVVDWDAHHGNGTEAAFIADPDVLTISVHQAGAFPHGSGAAERVGEGAGEGANVNVPLPPGSGVGAYGEVTERVVAPALRLHGSELIIVACGLDASPQDPLARMMVHSEGFRAMTRTLMEVADEICDGRLVCCHEGGYATAYVPFCGLAVVEQLAGVATGVRDPFLAGYASFPYQEVQPHQEAVIADAERRVARIPEAVTR